MAVPSAAGAGNGLGIRVYRTAKSGDGAGAAEFVRRYLAGGGAKSEIYELDRYGASAFMMWGRAGDEEVLAALEPYGIDWTVQGALAWRRGDIARRLCEQTPALIEGTDFGNPLHWALAANCLDFAAWALERTDVASTEGGGYVRTAVFGRHPDAIRFAVEALGADINYGGQPALHHECKHGWPKLVPLLIELGADPNVKDTKGNTALHLAAKRGTSRALVEMLLDAGADRTIRDADGETALDLARRAKKPHAAAALR